MSKWALCPQLYLKQLFRLVEDFFIPIRVIHQFPKHDFDG